MLKSISTLNTPHIEEFDAVWQEHVWQELAASNCVEFNEKLATFLKRHGLKTKVTFNFKQLENCVKEHGTFRFGVIHYLKLIESALDKEEELTTYSKRCILQAVGEISSMVFPRVSSAHSLIPEGLKEVDWRNVPKSPQLAAAKENVTDPVLLRTITELEKNPAMLLSMCAISVSDLFVGGSKNPEGIPNENDEATNIKVCVAPRVNSSTWVGRLRGRILVHLERRIESSAAREGKPATISGTARIGLTAYCSRLSLCITERLITNGIFNTYNTLKEDGVSMHKSDAKYYSWALSGAFLVMPKVLALPMVHAPTDWKFNEKGTMTDGGYWMAHFANLAYQGHIESKANRTHEHRYALTKAEHINRLQKVPFGINVELLNFVNKYQTELAKDKLLYVGDTWLHLMDADRQHVLYNEITQGATAKGNAVWERRRLGKIVSERRVLSLKNNETLRMAEYYANKPLWWVAFQDFRGRIYRMGALNFQGNPLTRSLVGFMDDGTRAGRRKASKASLRVFNQLLGYILNDETKIAKWSAHFGNRRLHHSGLEQLLYDDLLKNELNLAQVGQLLLLRKGKHNQLGFYFDATIYTKY